MTPTAAQFRAARASLGLTMEQVASEFPLTINAIWKAEKDLQEGISIMMLKRLQHAYESLGINFFRDEDSIAIWLPARTY